MKDIEMGVFRNAVSRKSLIVICFVSCLFLFCLNQFFKRKELESNIAENHPYIENEDIAEDTVEVTTEDTRSQYRLFEPNEDVEFPTVPDGVPKIPHIIHQVSDSGNVVDIFIAPIISFITHNPKWKYMFWTHGLGQKLLNDRYPKYLKIFEQLTGEKRNDYIRYAVIYEYGGVYSNMDVENLRSLDIATFKYSCIVPTEPFEHSALLYNMDMLLSNTFLLCRPKHPFFKHVLDNIQQVNTDDTANTVTGTVYLTELYLLYNNIKEEDLKKTKTDNSSNSPYFYKGTRLEDDDDAVYIPNTQYFIDDIDKELITTEGNLMPCVYSLNKMELQDRACSAFENRRKNTQESRPYAFTRHYWTHMWTFSEDKLRWLRRTSINDIVPDYVVYL